MKLVHMSKGKLRKRKLNHRKTLPPNSDYLLKCCIKKDFCLQDELKEDRDLKVQQVVNGESY